MLCSQCCVCWVVAASVLLTSVLVFLCLQRFLKYGTALAAKTESDFNSVERVVQYLTPETEAAEETAPEVLEKLPKDWPASECPCILQVDLQSHFGLLVGHHLLA